MTASLNRARSITVGTCFNGLTEVMMRANDGAVLWAPLQQYEVVELVHQLAANIGCHLVLNPREDFASWRKWNDEKKHITTSPEKLPDTTSKAFFVVEENQNEQTVAIEKSV